MKKGLSLTAAASLVGISRSYLSKLEYGRSPVNIKIRQRIMMAYGYSPSSFKNLSSDPVRSKAVPVRYKLDILLAGMTEEEMEGVLSLLQAPKTR